ncbi:hypothetical protein KDK95_16305 [Actinospica sp. MGRD01-02]|uniref:Uncharacterized protein n=1 Tax=Actinospica acidithermotolerans TaxID=2828514 RepID=A0A941EAY4_9ACTN|nr:hypothetical protein [Actinospica acidithermotolerans]MBR7827882.1 hypothetical protein [Actinospica acidithermotolerans]
MADEVQIDPELVTSVYNTCVNAVNSELAPDMASLQAVVQSLLSPAGGLYMQDTSAALEQEFTDFSANMQNLFNQILSFATTFQNIAGSLMNSDANMASQISSQTAAASTTARTPAMSSPRT